MRDELFQELLKSVREGGEILREEQAPARRIENDKGTAAKEQTSVLKERVRMNLRQRCSSVEDYVEQWQDNLLTGISPDWCKTDLEQGAGNELRTKFRALHSSSALAVNTFALFKSRLGDLAVNGRKGFHGLKFEKTLSTGLGGTQPNLDVWLEADNEVVAIESKFLEYLSPKKPSFSDSYKKEALPQVDNAWWQALENAKSADAQFLDVAQLVKHALGILNHLRANPQKSATLLYLFWEPTDAAEYDVFCQHRRQLREFQVSVQSSNLRFEYMSYPELWCQWQSTPALSEHTALLRQRYEFSLH